MGVKLAQKFGAKRFEIDGQRLDMAGEQGVSNQRRDGHDHACDRAVHGFGDTARDFRALGGEIGGIAGRTEDANQTENRPHEAEERSEAGNDFKESHAAFQPDDFPAGVGLNGVGIFILGPARIHQTRADKAGQRGVFVGGELLDQGGFAAVMQIVDRLGEVRLDHVRDSQRNHALKNNSQ